MTLSTPKRCLFFKSGTRISIKTVRLLRLFLVIQLISNAILPESLFGNRYLLCEAWTHSLLFKSKETFKLAEIQNLEASLQTAHSEFVVDDAHDDTALLFNLTRLVVDRATGSSLFRLDLQSKTKNELSFTTVLSNDDAEVSLQAEQFLRSRIFSLSSLQRCDWIGQVVTEGHYPHELVENLQKQQDDLISPNRYGFETDDWNLDYVKLVGDVASNKKPTYTMKSLLCAVAHEMPSRPALSPDRAKSKFLIVDTATEEANSCFLIQCIGNVPKMEGKSSLQQKWAQRPFQYSSAINFEIAEMVMEILLTLCNERNEHVSEGGVHSKRVLLDPTCGSGTFLALALANDFHVEGCDINSSVADGALRNIEYLFGNEKVEACANVESRDSCSPWRKEESLSSNETSDISCVVANLPWGRNSVLYMDENERILRSVRSQIQCGTPCAFITRPSNSGENVAPSLLFESTGFDVLGQAFVPQRDFLLPVGKKKRKKSHTDNSKDVTSDSARKQSQCVVTIARAKEHG